MNGNLLHVTLRTADWVLPSLQRFMERAKDASHVLREKTDGTGVFFDGEVVASNESKSLHAFWWVAYGIRMGLPQSCAMHGTGVAMRRWLLHLNEATNGLFYRTCLELNLGKAQDGVSSLPMSATDVVWRCFMTQHKTDRTPAFGGWNNAAATALGDAAYHAYESFLPDSQRWSGASWARGLLQSNSDVLLGLKDGTGSNWAQWLAAHTDGFVESPACWTGILNAMEACGNDLGETNQLANSIMHSIAFNGQSQGELDIVFEWGLSRGVRWDIPNRKGLTALEMAFHNPTRKIESQSGEEEHTQRWPEEFATWRARWEAAALRQRVTGRQEKHTDIEIEAL